MKRLLEIVSGKILLGGLALAITLAPMGAFARPRAAQDSTAKDDIKDAGHATKKAAKKTGSATKKVTKKVVNKSAEKTGEAADKVKDKTDPKP